MRQSSYTIGAAQKEIRSLAGDHYVSINLKVAKTDVTASLVNGVLEAGTLIAADGKTVVTSESATTAYGVVFQDVDFNNSKGTEVVPVMIHGFVNSAKIKLDETNGAVEKKALSMIAFL